MRTALTTRLLCSGIVDTKAFSNAGMERYLSKALAVVKIAHVADCAAVSLT